MEAIQHCSMLYNMLQNNQDVNDKYVRYYVRRKKTFYVRCKLRVRALTEHPRSKSKGVYSLYTDSRQQRQLDTDTRHVFFSFSFCTLHHIDS